MKHSTIFFLGAIALLLTFTQCNAKIEPQIVNIWGDNMPYDNNLAEPEDLIGGGYLATNVAIPQLEIYKAKNNPSGKAIIVCPGGGYAALAIGHEGRKFAEWLNTIGITGIVLKYRLPNGVKEIPLADVQQAVRYVRSHASEIGIDANQIGLAGFSAGGHLATLGSTRFDTEGVSSRPDFSILYYPVVSMSDECGHTNTRAKLLGDSLVQADMDYFSNELHVTKDTPPAIIFVSDNDLEVNPMNSTLYQDALRKNGVPVAMYVFPRGGHGWGMSPEHMDFTYYEEMLNLLERWLTDLKL